MKETVNCDKESEGTNTGNEEAVNCDDESEETVTRHGEWEENWNQTFVKWFVVEYTSTWRVRFTCELKPRVVIMKKNPFFEGQ